MNKIALGAVAAGLVNLLLRVVVHSPWATRSDTRAEPYSDGVFLVLKTPVGFQTVSMLDGTRRTGLYYDSGELIGKLKPDARSVVLLGLGGGEMIRAARRTLPHAEYVGVEIDPHTAELARSLFRVDAKIELDDAINWIARQPPGSFDAVMVDLYDNDGRPPENVGYVFYTDCARALRPGGVLLMNVWPLTMSANDTLHEIAKAGFTVWRDDTWAPNTMLVATVPTRSPAPPTPASR